MAHGHSVRFPWCDTGFTLYTVDGALVAIACIAQQKGSPVFTHEGVFCKGSSFVVVSFDRKHKGKPSFGGCPKIHNAHTQRERETNTHRDTQRHTETHRDTQTHTDTQTHRHRCTSK